MFLCEQIRAGLRELHIGAALVLPKPAARDRETRDGLIFTPGAPRSWKGPLSSGAPGAQKEKFARSTLRSSLRPNIC